MADYSKVVAKTVETWEATDRSTLGNQCDFVCSSFGLPVAHATAEFSQMEYRLRSVLAMESRRYMGKDSQCPEGKSSQIRRQEATPTVAIVDSQSVRTAEGGEERGYDAGKKITGRKRHLAVDTLGLILTVVVHGAYWQDYDSACFVLTKLKEKFRRLKVVFGDSAYGKNGLPEWVKESFGWILQTVLRPVGVKGFVILPKRWIVERTFGWLGRYRRNSKDYERTTKSSETMIYISMINLMSRRLAHTTI